jgi:XTP/dITP diphosphohydrolase
LSAFPPEKRTVHYACVLALLFPDGREIVREGRCSGVLRDFYAGTNGFGYDPLFLDPASGRTGAELSREEKMARSHRGKTMAEMTMEEKNEISHRGKALELLVEALS